ncbi:DUF7677 family protein [Streptomyces mirabilis]
MATPDAYRPLLHPAVTPQKNAVRAAPKALPDGDAVPYWGGPRLAPRRCATMPRLVIALRLATSRNALASVLPAARVAQWIRRYCDPTYEVEPPFQAWETELHGP